MQVKLTHRDPSVYPTSNVLERHRPIRLGAWNGADLRVTGNEGEEIAKIHALVEIVGDCVKLRHLAPTKAPVLLNGSPVVEGKLQNGDVVSIGKTRLEVEIFDPEAASRAAPPPVIDLAAEGLPTGLVAYRPAGDGADLRAVLEKLTAVFTPLVMANFLAAGEEPPPWLAADADLLAEAPRDQIGDNSLHLLAADDLPAEADDPADPAERSAAATQRLIELFHQLRTKTGAAMLIGAGDKQAVLETIRFRRGFYASATGLELFLRQGSAVLAQKLIEGLHAILIASADDEWTLYANAKLVTSVDDLNLGASAGVKKRHADAPQ
ncbi:MAG: hypothetical protein IT424_11885 [Pirellulales bacterium]|nr:hypothetical protein [Pirellulales bacterium]